VVIDEADAVENPDDREPPGSWLRRQRAAAGLTQEDLAERSGVTARTIGNLERGRAGKPYPGSIRRVATALGLSQAQIDELITRYRSRTVPAPSGPAGGDDGTGAAPSPPDRGPGGTGTVRAPVPRQLPAAIRNFVGRAAELEALAGLLGDGGQTGRGMVIALVTGMGGVGKTALAAHWAHQVAGLFPGGQLYVNLRGFDPGGSPAAPTEVVRGFLDALGVAPERVPAGLDAQAGLYRSLMADKRMLIMLDNARDEQQVRPLIPASPASLVLVTSRSQLTGLAAAEDARLVSLDLLSSAEARQVLTARIGAARVTAEPDAVTQIADLCGCLPLALAVAAARAAARPRLPLAALVAELRDAAGRLDALDAGDTTASVRAVFSWSYQQLRPGPARMFRLLGVHPGPDISIPAAASLTGSDQAQARRELTELTRAHLIAEHAPGRYALHDLVRAYAASQAQAADSDASRHEAIGRILDHYLHTAAQGCLVLSPARERLTPPPPRPGVRPEQLTDTQQALTWFEAEHQILFAAAALAGDHGFDIHCWQLPWALSTFLNRRMRWWQEWFSLQPAAVAAAMRLGDKRGEAISRRMLAFGRTRLGQYEQAHADLMVCLGLFQQLGDRQGEARIHADLSLADEHLGRFEEYLAHVEQALAISRAIGDRVGEAGALNSVGWHYAHGGEYRKAQGFYRQAIALHAELGLPYGEAHSWDSLGYAEHQLGHLSEAADCYRHALELFRELGDSFNTATTLIRLGDNRHRAAEPATARDAWHQALQILDELQHPEADRVRTKLGQLGDPLT
jgi:tetratricopeptide (TPR) repeat protein/DNA-binding XRE family transcriptional regulator